jgi:hypothetical protein
MLKDTVKKRKKSTIKLRILVSLVMGTGLVLCFANVVVVVHIMDVQNSETRHIRSMTSIINVNKTVTKVSLLVGEKTVSVPQGKERLLRMLAEAGVVYNISQEFLRQLPTWEQVVDLYGDSPKIIGLETCSKFRDNIDPTEALIGPAGPFNSGTNLLAELLWSNCILPKRFQKYNHAGLKWQVNWGKHHPPRFRLQHSIDKSINNTNIMPVIAVRDPYSWMQSMCRERYAAHWSHASDHCPNLVFTRTSSQVVPVYVRYNLITTHHESLAHMWNDWYDEYLQADFPRLFVRVEDLVFHGRNVTETICKCVGGDPLGNEFRYILENAKIDGTSTNGQQYNTTLLDAMIRYGQLNRTKGMTKEDAAYAQGALRHDLMEMFGYSHPNER